MSTEGKVIADNVVVAKVDAMKTVNGKNAYEMAVLHGYTGTFEDWIASITSGRLTEGHREAIADLVIKKNRFAIELEKNARIEADNFILEALGLDEVSETAYENYCLNAVNRINETLGFVQPEFKDCVFGERHYVTVTLENYKEKYNLQSVYDDENSHTFTFDFTSYRGCKLVCRSDNVWNDNSKSYGYALYDEFGDEILLGGNAVTVEGNQGYDFIIDIPSNAGNLVISCHNDSGIIFDIEPIFDISKNVNALMEMVPAVDQTIITNSTNPVSSKAVYEYGEGIKADVTESIGVTIDSSVKGAKDYARMYVDDKIDETRDALEGINREITGEIGFDVVEGYWIRNNDGSFVSDTKYSMTEPIDCVGLDSITIQHNFTYVGNNAFYDETGGFVGSINLYKNPYRTTVPEKATTFRLSALTDELKEAKIFVGQGIGERVTNLEDEQESLRESINRQDDAIETINNQLLEKTEVGFTVVKDSYVVLENGKYSYYAGWDRTEPINCVPGSKITVTSPGSSKYNAFYKNDGTFETFIVPCEGITVPDNAITFVLSAKTENLAETKVIFSSSLNDQINVLKKEKVTTVNGVVPDENGNVDITIPEAKTSCETDGECYFVRKEMKSYFKDYPEDVVADNYMDSRIESVPQGNSFVFVTDVHYPDNNKNSLMPMLYAYKKLGLKTVVHGGDVLCETIDRNLATLELRKWTNDMRSCFGKYMLPVFGNHDANWADIELLTEEEENRGLTIYSPEVKARWENEIATKVIPYANVEKIFLNGNRRVIVQETEEEIRAKALNWFPTITDEDMEDLVAWYKLHYYFDDHEYKTRHIILNKAGFSPIIWRCAQSDAEFEYRMQFEWLYDVLLDTPDDYNIALSCHILTDYETNTIPSAALSIMNLLSLAKNNASAWKDIAVGHDGNSFIFENKQFDFSAHNRTGKIICLCGHSHWDSACVCHTVDGTYKSEVYTDSLTIGDDGVLVIMTQTDAIKGQVTEAEAKDTDNNYPAWSSTMTSDTATEQCFDIVTLTDDNVVCTRIGAGEDRVFKY